MAKRVYVQKPLTTDQQIANLRDDKRRLTDALETVARIEASLAAATTRIDQYNAQTELGVAQRSVESIRSGIAKCEAEWGTLESLEAKMAAEQAARV